MCVSRLFGVVGKLDGVYDVVCIVLCSVSGMVGVNVIVLLCVVGSSVVSWFS